MLLMVIIFIDATGNVVQIFSRLFVDIHQTLHSIYKMFIETFSSTPIFDNFVVFSQDDDRVVFIDLSEKRGLTVFKNVLLSVAHFFFFFFFEICKINLICFFQKIETKVSWFLSLEFSVLSLESCPQTSARHYCLV